MARRTQDSSAGSDGARIAAVLDVRQVFGNDWAAQELLSGLLTDHDLLRSPDEDPILPALDSPLWGRLPEVHRRNALHRLGSGSAGGAGGRCPMELASPEHGEVHVGRHRFSVAQTDIQALARRWEGPEDPQAKAASMAHVLSLYRALESPLGPESQRGSMQLAWDPIEAKQAGIQYELFASPFNARVPNGRYASRWPHVESLFGSAGKYPTVIDAFPESAVVGVNPPFTEAFLEHVVCQSLDRVVQRFRKVHLFIPVREAPWRSQLHRLQGAQFVRQFWDATAKKQRSLGQPVLHWEGSQLADA